MGFSFLRAVFLGLFFIFPLNSISASPFEILFPSRNSWGTVTTSLPNISKKPLALRCATPASLAHASALRREKQSPTLKSPASPLSRTLKKIFSSGDFFVKDAWGSWDVSLWLNRPDVNAGVLRRVSDRLQVVEQALRGLHLEPGSQGYLVSDPPAVFLLKETYNTLAFLKDVLEDPNHTFRIAYDAAAFANLSPDGVDTVGLFDRGRPGQVNIREEWRDPRDPGRTLDLETYAQVCSATPAPTACRTHSREDMIGLYTKNLVHEMAHHRLHEINYADIAVPAPPYRSAEVRESFTSELFSYGVESIFGLLKPNLLEPVPANDMERAILPFFNKIRTQLQTFSRGESDVASERRQLASQFLADFNPSYEWYRPGTDPFPALRMLTEAFDQKGMLLETLLLNREGAQVYTRTDTDWQTPGAFETVSDACGKDSIGRLVCARVATHCYGPTENSRCVDRTSFGLNILYRYEGPPPSVNLPQKKIFFPIPPALLGFSAPADSRALSVLPYPYHLGAVDAETGEPPSLADVAERVRQDQTVRPSPPEAPRPLAEAQRESCRPPEGRSGSCVEPIRDRGGCNYSNYRTEYDDQGQVVGFYRTDCFASEGDGHCVCSSPAFYGAPAYETTEEGHPETRIEIEGGGDLCRNDAGGFSACDTP